MHQHGEGELMEQRDNRNAITKQTAAQRIIMMKKTTSTFGTAAMICRVHHMNKTHCEKKGKVHKLSQAVDLSCRACPIQVTYRCVRYNCLMPPK